MRAWAVVETGAPLQALDMPTPEPQGAEVLVEVTHCGVCHSDLHIWEGGYDLGSRGKLSLQDRGVVLPLAMGHEIVGRVAAMGPDARGVALGEAKVVFPWIGCGQCERCQSGEDNMCPNAARTLGIYRNGGYATHVLVPDAKYLVPVDGVEPAVAATYACSGITVHSAIKKLGTLPPDRPVVLVGAGGLGLNAIHMLKALGHRRIVSVDVSAEKLEAARAAGATDTVLAQGSDGTEVTKAIVAACSGPAMAVIDLVNGSATARFAFDALGKGGKLVQVGLFGGEMSLPLPLMAIRALTIQGSYVGSLDDLNAVMALAKEGKLAALPVTTEPMEKANAVLERLRDGKVTGRVVLRAEAA
ncbi:alcohol dehydrogenase catalytic domain-containing protein [Roseomonas sp. SSH11]|uniref:alcohol dehydrogenase n=1 Tax=Pararoseomonas baculiformis TaxID=2820812 RepID=A0ABS4AK31_9PROT|nr:alcohol dehydrogenase [Pararoseomonas baculiformis]MBP0446843.1 alcohol dehydrogenase catalytic domain-containing protein [Pararoseomonas baculiformis]